MAKKRTGRPTKEAKPGERVSLGLKVTGETKKRIDEAAKQSGRTQSQVAELWLEHAMYSLDVIKFLIKEIVRQGSQHNQTAGAVIARATITVPEAGEILGISRGQAYEAARSGDIPTIRIGRRLLVPMPAFNRLLSGVNGEPHADKKCLTQIENPN